MHNTLGLITPDITRSLGFISMEANRTLSGLGLITPDITRSLGAEPQTFTVGKAVLGVPLTTWALVIGATGIGTATAGYLATGSGKAAYYSAVGGMASSAAGIAVAGLLVRRAIGKLSAGGTF